MNNYIKISHKGNTSIVYTSLTKILQELDDHFIRILKSFIINRLYVQSFNSELVELENAKVPVGFSYKEQIKLL